MYDFNESSYRRKLWSNLKMSLIATVGLILLSLACQGQDETALGGVLPIKEGKVIYEGVETVDGVSKEELYRRAKSWLVNAYRSAKDVIQLDDKENFTIIGKGNLPTYWQVTFYASQQVSLLHTITLQFKDGRYRYEITDLIMDYYVAPSAYVSGGPQKLPLESMGGKGAQKGGNTKKYYAQVNERILATVEDMKTTLRKPIKDW